MEPPVDAKFIRNKKFINSGESSCIYDYKCFEDLSLKSYRDGSEVKNSSDWAKSSKRRWLFFYNPHSKSKYLASEQKSKIDDLNKEKSSVDGDLFALAIIIVVLALLSMMLIPSDYPPFFKIAFAPLAGLIFFIIYYMVKAGKAIRLKSDIEDFEKEASYLSSLCDLQAKESYDGKDVEYILWEDICRLEQSLVLPELSGKVLQETAGNFYEKFKGDYPLGHKLPRFPVMLSWSVLQNNHSGDKDYHQSLKLKRSLGNKIFTWRGSEKGKPFFRAWSISYFVFLKSSLEIYSFDYDFVTKKIYNYSIKDVYYSHIKECSIEHVDLSLMKYLSEVAEEDLPKVFVDKVFNSSVKRLSFCSSGDHNFGLNLIGGDVIDGLNDWLLESEGGDFSTGEKEVLAENGFEIFNLIATDIIKNLNRSILDVSEVHDF